MKHTRPRLRPQALRRLGVTPIAACIAAAMSGGHALADDAPNPIVNAGFDVPERAYIRPQSADDEFEGIHTPDEFPAWTFDSIGEQLILTDTDNWPLLDGAGGVVMRFSETDDGFGDNRIEQFIDLGGEDDTIDVNLFVTTHQPKGKDFNEPLSVRMQVRFLDSGGDQVGDDAEATGHLVLPGVDGNDAAGDVTLELDPLQIVSLPLADVSVPAGATQMRLRLAARDRTDGGGQPDGPRFIFFDRVEATGSTVGAIDNANADFSDTGDVDREDFFSVVVSFPDDDQGPLGWHLTDIENDDYEDPIPASVIIPTLHLPEEQQFDAHSGERVWRWQNLGSSFGDDNLDQCFALGGIDGSITNTDFNFAVWARSPEDVSSDDVIRLGVQFFGDLDDCLNHGDTSFENEFDYTLDEPDAWQALFTETLTPDADATAVRISLRARDPFGGESFPIYFDTVTPWILQQPTLDFEGGDSIDPNDPVRVEVPGLPSGGVTVHFTTDGSDPTTDDEAVTPGETIALLEDDADEDGTIVLRAAAFKEGWTTSTAAEAEFTLATEAPEPDPEPDTPPPPRGSSGGCTVGDPGAPLDPTLALLALLAGTAVYMRRRRRVA